MATFELPPSVQGLLDRGLAVLVAGTGTAPAVRPRWPAVIDALSAHLQEPGAERQVRALMNQERTGAALAILRDRLGVTEARRVVAQATAPLEEVPPILQELAALPWRAILTTELDDGWPRACVAAGEDPIILSAGVPVEGAAGSGRPLVQVLGRAAQPETLCLAPADVRANVTATGLGELLSEMAQALSLVFVGFRATDPDLELLADQILGGQLGEQHLFLCDDEGGPDADLVHARWGVTPVTMILDAGAPPPQVLWRHLHEELETHLAAERWGDAVPVLEKLSSVEEAAPEQARCLQSAGLICRDRLGDGREAFRLFSAALDRLGPDGEIPLRARLWDAAGRLAWKSLSDPETALAALEAAQALAPSDDREGMLADVATAAGPAAAGKAIALQRRLAARNPDDPRPYRGLARLFSDAGQPERARWAAAALAALEPGVAAPPVERVVAGADLTGLWDGLRHPEEDPRVSAACARLVPELRRQPARAPEELTGPGRALTWSTPGAPAGEDRAQAALQAAADALGVTAPVLARGVELPERIALHHLTREGQPVLALVLDERFAAEAPAAELAFAVTRAVALSRPEWCAPFLSSPVVLADRLRPELGELDLRRWAAACELSAARAALLVTGDLGAARRVIAVEPPAAGVLAAEERIKDLLVFAVSDAHFSARRALGLDDTPTVLPPPAEDPPHVDAR